MKLEERENHRSQKKKSQGMRKLTVVLGCILCMVIFAAGRLTVFGISGKYNLKKQAVSYSIERDGAMPAVLEASGEENVWQDGQVRYKKQDYRYNNDIMTFLIMGIDKERKADALFLFVLEPHEKAMKLLPISSTTMTEVDVYDEQGVRTDTMMAQIGIQYRFGDGGKASCEYQAEAVSNFLNGITVNGYLAVDMDVIPEIIKLFDDVDMEIPEDISAGGREEEQIYLLTEFIVRGRQLAGRDFTFPVRIYNEIADWIVTDMTTDEVAYLAVAARGYRFGPEQVVMVPGKGIGKDEKAEDGCDEFYVDEEALDELILDIFYKPVD